MGFLYFIVCFFETKKNLQKKFIKRVNKQQPWAAVLPVATVSARTSLTPSLVSAVVFPTPRSAPTISVPVRLTSKPSPPASTSSPVNSNKSPLKPSSRSYPGQQVHDQEHRQGSLPHAHPCSPLPRPPYQQDAFLRPCPHRPNPCLHPHQAWLRRHRL